MAAPPWLSVLMPTYNGADHLRAALDGILAQGHRRIEVIAVDDGSTDATVAILKSYARKLPLRLVRRQRPGNWVTNTNHALSLAKGDWACFLHQDDVWFKNRLAQLRTFIDQRPSAALVIHPAWYIDSDGKRLGLWRCPLPARAGYQDPRLVMDRLVVQNFIALPAPIFRRKTAVRLGGLQEDVPHSADWDFWLKLAGTGRVGYLPLPLAGFRIHPFSQSFRLSCHEGDVRHRLKAVMVA
jgi:glycosyltransferase involved in cell wall biosynthesis